VAGYSTPPDTCIHGHPSCAWRLVASSDVDPETRERIMRIINEHRYVPSGTASRLARGRSHLLGAFVASWLGEPGGRS
jgi:hypothetical protein